MPARRISTNLPEGAPPCTPSASTAPSRSATSRNCGHNRYHPDIAPAAEIGEGEEIALETRDALDGQITPATTVADFAALDAGAVHPLTGPVFVKGAQPGDMLEIEFIDIIPQPHRVQRDHAGARLPARRDDRAVPGALAASRTAGRPRRSFPACAFPARRSWACRPSRPRAEQLAAWTAREQRVIDARRLRAAARCRRRGARPGRAASPACARCRRARTAATSTSSSSPRARSCSCRCSRRARCSPPATATSPRATARSASPRSRWAPPPWCASRCTRGWRARRKFAAPVFSRDDLLRRSALRRARALPRRHGHADQRRRARTRRENLTLACRNARAQHDRAAAGARLHAASRPT